MIDIEKITGNNKRLGQCWFHYGEISLYDIEN